VGWVAIKDLVKKGRTKPSLPDEIVWHINLDQIESGTGRVLSKLRLPAGEAGNSTQSFEAGTVLYSKLRPYLNKVVVADERGVATTELVPLRVREDLVIPEYLVQYLRSDAFLSQASERVTGAKMPRVILDWFWNHEVPLPPVEEQRRIAHLLDEADRLQRLRKEANEKAQRILPALFVEMFGDPETNPMGWETRKVGELATVKGGKRLPKGTPYAEGITSHPYVRAGDITATGVRTSELKYITPEIHARISRYVIRPNSVLITIAGKIGVAAAAPEPLYGANMTENAAIITLADRNQMNPVYLAALLNTLWCQGQIDTATGRVTIGKLALFRIEALEVYVPPIELQDSFAQMCEAVTSIAGLQACATESQDSVAAALRSRLFAEAV